MKNNTLRPIVICIMVSLIWLSVCSTASGQEAITSPLNGKVLNLSETPLDYSFFVAGHVYGAPTNPSVYPSASFLANIDMINQDNTTFLILLGDNYRVAVPKHVDNFKTSALSKIEIPVFNTVGNHDVTNRTLYEYNFGKTYFDFREGSELFIILDSEQDQGEIVGEQLAYLKNVLNYAHETENITNIFIIIHKLIWSVGDEDLSIVYNHLNNQQGYARNDNFKSIVMPEIVMLSPTKKIYFISGDIGCKGSLPLFYHKDEIYNITYIASGLGDTANDAIIKVEISKEGEVNFRPISLTGDKLEDIDHYGVDYWTSHFEFNLENVKYRLNRTFGHIYFKSGIVFTLIIFSIFAGIIFSIKRIIKND